MNCNYPAKDSIIIRTRRAMMHDEGNISAEKNSSLEHLQLILQAKDGYSSPIDDVREIAYDLVSFFELLAKGDNE